MNCEDCKQPLTELRHEVVELTTIAGKDSVRRYWICQKCREARS